MCYILLTMIYIVSLNTPPHQPQVARIILPTIHMNKLRPREVLDSVHHRHASGIQTHNDGIKENSARRSAHKPMCTHRTMIISGGEN